MGFLPIVYAGTFFFIAICGYVCLSVVAGLDRLGKRVFVAVLGFGACSYVGFIVAILAISVSPFKTILEGQTRPFMFALAYFLPGLVGGWLSLKVLGAIIPPKRQE
jgi:hypothetical protein